MCVVVVLCTDNNLPTNLASRQTLHATYTCRVLLMMMWWLMVMMMSDEDDETLTDARSEFSKLCSENRETNQAQVWQWFRMCMGQKMFNTVIIYQCGECCLKPVVFWCAMHSRVSCPSYRLSLLILCYRPSKISDIALCTLTHSKAYAWCG